MITAPPPSSVHRTTRRQPPASGASLTRPTSNRTTHERSNPDDQ
jgi:hypothetical protein